MNKIVIGIYFCLCCSSLLQCKSHTQQSNLAVIKMQEAKLCEFTDHIVDVSGILLERYAGYYPSSIKKITFYKGYFYILSNEEFSVYIYNKDGKYVNLIKASRTENGAFYPHNFFLDEKEDKLYVFSMIGNQIHAYDLSGNLLGQFSFGMKVVNLCRYDDARFLVFEGGHNQGLPYSLYLADIVDSTYRKGLLLKTKKQRREGANPPSVFAKDQETEFIYSLFPNNDTIYLSNAQKNQVFEPYYWIDLGGEFFDDQKYPEKGLSMKEEAELIKSNQYVLGIQNFFTVSKKLFFSLSGKRHDYYIIDLKNNELYTFKNLFPRNTMFMVGSTSDQLIFTMTPNDLKRYYKQKKSESSFPSIQKFLNQEGDSWVILLLKIK